MKSKLVATKNVGKLGNCPKCGTALRKQKFIDTWDVNDNPEQISDYYVCDKCQVAWDAFDITSMVPYKGK